MLGSLLSRKRGQIWVETVIYTLIGLAIIGIVLAVSKPKIDAKKDEILIEQAIESLQDIDNKISAVRDGGAGSRRIIQVEIGKGYLEIDTDKDEIRWVVDSRFEYSGEGEPVSIGDINVTTIKDGPWKVILVTSYSVDIQYKDKTSGTMKLDSAPTPYSLSIEHSGRNNNANVIVQIGEI